MYKKIMELTLKNGGYTLETENSGRYVVATGINETIVKEISEKVLKEYHDTVKELNNDNYTLGTWFNKKNGMFYLDTVELVDDLETAKKLGKERNELAIYDLKENVEIELND